MNHRLLAVASMLTFMLLLCEAAFVARPVSAVIPVDPEPVYALPGTLQRAEGQSFLTYFVTLAGDRYAIYGETPEVDAEIRRIQEEMPEAVVKVWGELYPAGQQYPGPEIIATAVQLEKSQATSTPTQTATPQPTQAPVAIGRFSYVNIHSEPNQASSISGQIVADERCDVVGRVPTNSWLLIQCSSGLGWVPSTVVTLEGSLSGVTVYGIGAYVVQIPNVSDSGIAPTVTPAATPVPNEWHASYYGNISLAGVPVMEQDIAEISFNWGYDSPGPDVPVDDFSALFERTIPYAPNEYRLCLCNLDDGARLWMNGELIIDGWREGSARNLYVDKWLSGSYRVQIQYFESVSLASLSFTQQVIDASANEWQASYWNNTSMEGQAVLSRSEPVGDSVYVLNHDWGSGSPEVGVISPDIFSARWDGVFTFDTNSYVFEATSDDGVRVYVDDTLVLRGWGDGYGEQRSGVYSIGEGQHHVRVEYYERTGNALVRLRWYVYSLMRDQ